MSDLEKVRRALERARDKIGELNKLCGMASIGALVEIDEALSSLPSIESGTSSGSANRNASPSTRTNEQVLREALEVCRVGFENMEPASITDAEIIRVAIAKIDYALAFEPDFDEQSCPGHVASKGDAKICGRCGVHIDSLRPDDGEE
jgi:hypothetical protein